MYSPAIYDAAWFASQKWQHPWCERLMGWLVGVYWPFASSLDLGAGDGYYSHALNKMGVDAYALELSDMGLAHLPGRDTQAIIHDLRKPLDLLRDYELVLCIEVAEHLPASAADVLCTTIARHTGRLLVFTAAPPGQEGHGHVNCQPPEYWRRRLAGEGMIYLDEDTQHIRRAWGNILRKSVIDWLPRNVMLFGGVNK